MSDSVFQPRALHPPVFQAPVFQAPPFDPLFRNGHLATLAGNFWPRPISEERWPASDVFYQPEPDVKLLVRTQFPNHFPNKADSHLAPKGHVILVHGLEGSSESGYMRSMAHALLSAGYAVHRLNIRGCGGTPWYPKANYHSGQTGDLRHVAETLKRAHTAPIFAVGFSLGGNQVLKLAGELGERGRELLAGACAVSAPIDLAASVRQTAARENFLYQRRFVSRLRERVIKRNPISPDLFPLEHLPKIRSIWDFDDYYTSKIFGFGTAADYYRTQSSNQFLSAIRVPTLVVQAKDDPMIPFSIFDLPAFRENPFLQLIAVPHGGHVGFLARKGPRFWLDALLPKWLAELANTNQS